MKKSPFDCEAGASACPDLPGYFSRVPVVLITGQIILVPPYFENFGKRLIKSPKVYQGDSGLVC